ncbi:hypothetical protein HY992_00390 [Candidatus Micrarchaeota archaeon]|nr:hypothetical protein [Candidatus Micrarchaeota archaeon]
MQIKSLQDIQHKDVARLVDSTIYGRGEEYFHEGRVINPVFTGDKLNAEVQGNSRSNYHTSVGIKDGEIVGECDCPYDWGVCKHVVALLLHWLKKRRDFEDLGAKLKRIEQLSHEDLLKLVKDFAEEEPQKFFEVADVAVPGLVPEKRAPDYSKKAVHLLASHGDERPKTVLRRLQNIRKQVLAREKIEVSDYIATQLFGLATAFFEEDACYDDQDGSFSLFAEECLEKIAAVWKKQELAEKTRKAILKKSWEIIVKDEEPGFAETFEEFFESICRSAFERRLMRKPIIQSIVQLEERGAGKKDSVLSYEYRNLRRIAEKFGYMNKQGVYLQD